MLDLKKCTVAGSLLSLVVATGAVASEMATGEQIEDLLKGNTLHGGAQSMTYSEYYDPDGTIRGEGYTAAWKIEGDTGCMDYDGKGFKCWELKIVDGPTHIWYLDGAPSAAGVVVPGNPNGF